MKNECDSAPGGDVDNPRFSAIVKGDKSLERKMYLSFGFLFLYGLLLPNNWSEIFGVFGLPIAAMADFVPAIRKVVDISPIAELVRGFFGFGYLVIPLISIWFIWNDPMAERVEAMPARMAPHPIRKVLFIYAIGLPVCVLIIWLFWEFPGAHRLGLTPTKGQMLFGLVMSSRIFLSTFGAFFIVALGMLLWSLIVAIAGPLILISSRRKT